MAMPEYIVSDVDVGIAMKQLEELQHLFAIGAIRGINTDIQTQCQRVEQVLQAAVTMKTPPRDLEGPDVSLFVARKLNNGIRSYGLKVISLHAPPDE